MNFTLFNQIIIIHKLNCKMFYSICANIILIAMEWPPNMTCNLMLIQIQNQNFTRVHKWIWFWEEKEFCTNFFVDETDSI